MALCVKQDHHARGEDGEARGTKARARRRGHSSVPYGQTEREQGQGAQQHGQAEAQGKGRQVAGAAAQGACDARGRGLQSVQVGQAAPFVTIARALPSKQAPKTTTQTGNSYKRLVTKATFVGEGFTRKPPKYERFIRPMALRFKKAHVTHPELNSFAAPTSTHTQAQSAIKHVTPQTGRSTSTSLA